MTEPVDPYLIRLAEAAEEGADCHYVRLLVGSAVIVGKPCSFEDFSEAMVPPMKAETWELTGKDFGTRAPDEARRRQKFEEKTDARSAMLRARPDPSAQGTMTLRQVQWLPSSGDGLKLPAIRVSLASIDGWWVAGGEPVSSSRSGGSFFVGGGIFSLGDV